MPHLQHGGASTEPSLTRNLVSALSLTSYENVHSPRARITSIHHPAVTENEVVYEDDGNSSPLLRQSWRLESDCVGRSNVHTHHLQQGEDHRRDTNSSSRLEITAIPKEIPNPELVALLFFQLDRVENLPPHVLNGRIQERTVINLRRERMSSPSLYRPRT